jgi:5-methylcytosine-specific restriction enzyme A
MATRLRRPCLSCSDLTRNPSGYCDEHATQRRKLYKGSWSALSVKARKLQSWCSRCLSPGEPGNPLTLHHTVEAISKVQAGKSLTMRDAHEGRLIVLCQRCNNREGAAR